MWQHWNHLYPWTPLPFKHTVSYQTIPYHAIWEKHYQFFFLVLSSTIFVIKCFGKSVYNGNWLLGIMSENVVKMNKELWVLGQCVFFKAHVQCCRPTAFFVIICRIQRCLLCSSWIPGTWYFNRKGELSRNPIFIVNCQLMLFFLLDI